MQEFEAEVARIKERYVGLQSENNQLKQDLIAAREETEFKVQEARLEEQAIQARLDKDVQRLVARKKQLKTELAEAIGPQEFNKLESTVTQALKRKDGTIAGLKAQL
jgi:hypothetical protein